MEQIKTPLFFLLGLFAGCTLGLGASAALTQVSAGGGGGGAAACSITLRERVGGAVYIVSEHGTGGNATGGR